MIKKVWTKIKGVNIIFLRIQLISKTYSLVFINLTKKAILYLIPDEIYVKIRNGNFIDNYFRKINRVLYLMPVEVAK